MKATILENPKAQQSRRATFHVMRTQHAKTNTTLQNSHRQTPKREERSLKCILEG